MPTYSYKQCADPKMGATVYEDDKAILITAYQKGWENGDHDDLAEYICSMLTLLGVGKESSCITDYVRKLETDNKAVQQGSVVHA